MTKQESIDNFIKKMIEADKIISEKQNKGAEERVKNRKAWEQIENKLNKLVGKQRTTAYELYKFHSLTYIPMGTQLLNKLINEMSTIERNLLNK